MPASALSVLPDVKNLRDTILSGASPSWAVFSYAAGTSTLKLHESGDDLLDFQEAFEDSQIHYGFLRIQQGDLQKFALVLWCGEAVPVSKRGWLQAHTNEIKSLFQGYHVEIDARNENDIDPTTILKKVRTSGGSKYTSHASNQKPAYQDNEPPKGVGSVYEPTKTNPGRMASGGGGRMMAGSMGGSAQQIREERERREREQMESERQRSASRSVYNEPERVGSSWKPVQTAPKPFTSRPAFGNKPPVAPKPSFGAKPAGFAKKPPVAAKPGSFSGNQRTGSAVQSLYGNARQELTLNNTYDDEDPDASVGSNYLPVKTNPRPLGSSNRASFDEPEPLNSAEAVRKAREAYDRELLEREKKKAYAQDRPDDLDGLSGADRIRKEREAYDAELRQREEERIRRSGESLDEDHVVGSAQDVRREREEYDRQLREREEERIKRWEANEGAGSRDASLPALPGRPSAQSSGSGYGRLAAPNSSAGSRSSSTTASPVPGAGADTRRKSSTTSAMGTQASWSMPGNANIPKAADPAPAPSLPSRYGSVEQAVVSQMNNVDIADDAPPPLPEHPQDEAAQEPAQHQPQNGEAGDAELFTVVALYDYEKSEDNELTFREGEKIVNVQKLQSDWWYGSRADGTDEGLFPANFVEEISTVVSLAQAEANLDQNGTQEQEPAQQSSGIVCQATFDFAGTDDQELPLREGDKIVDVEKASEEWWWGRVDGTAESGYFPANHVEEV